MDVVRENMKVADTREEGAEDEGGRRRTVHRGTFSRHCLASLS